MVSKIFSLICVIIQYATANQIFSHEYIPPDRIKLQTKYDHLRIERFKYGVAGWVTPQPDVQFAQVNDINPCTRYEIAALVTWKSNEQNQTIDYFTTDFGLIKPSANVSTYIDSIKIGLNFNRFDCIKNLSVLIHNTSEIVFTTHNLTSPLIISNVPHCLNRYKLKIILHDQFGQFKILHNNFIKMKPIKIAPVQNITYHPTKGLVTWSSGKSGNCSSTYNISIKPNNVRNVNKIEKLQVTRNEFELPHLIPCTEYEIKISPKGDDSLKRTERCKTVPGEPQLPHLISKTSNSLVIKSKYNETSDAGDNCRIEMFQFQCFKRGDFRNPRSILDENGIGNYTNLKSNVNYNCRTKVKNSAGWSNWSQNQTFKTQEHKTKTFIYFEFYLISVSSKSIHLGVTWFKKSFSGLEITIKKTDVLSLHCKEINYTNITLIGKNKTEQMFDNLEAHTTYSIKARNTHIFVTTDPDVPHQVNNLKIVNSTSHSVNISFELPCITNGRVKGFVGKFHVLHPSKGADLHWSLPFDISQNRNKFEYMENRIMPGHKYNITVGITLYKFISSLNESAIEFTAPKGERTPRKILVTRNTLSNSIQLIWYVVIVIMSIALVASSVGGLWYYKVRKNQIPIPFNSTYIEVKNFPNWYKPINVDDCIADQFESLENINLTTLPKLCAEKHRIKNRYLDITPYDYNRVILKPNSYCTTDYINASYIDGYKYKNQYIATQGPKEETVYDFWHMVIEKKCSKIVMLAQVRENNMLKCFQYFPQDTKVLKFDDLIVRIMGETDFGNFIRRDIIIGKGLAFRSVIHFQYVKWPDRDCPDSELDFLEFVEFTKSKDNKSSNPMIVHCSAGVGRTGTFIALDILLQQLINEKFFSVYETVKQLRLQRSGMVQTLNQYQFVYAAINKYYLRQVYK